MRSSSFQIPKGSWGMEVGWAELRPQPRQRKGLFCWKEMALSGSHAPWGQEGAPQPQATARNLLPVFPGVSLKEEAVEGRSRQARSEKPDSHLFPGSPALWLALLLMSPDLCGHEFETEIIWVLPGYQYAT